jgi:hypothetical protein
MAMKVDFNVRFSRDCCRSNDTDLYNSNLKAARSAKTQLHARQDDIELAESIE